MVEPGDARLAHRGARPACARCGARRSAQSAAAPLSPCASPGAALASAPPPSSVRSAAATASSSASAIVSASAPLHAAT